MIISISPKQLEVMVTICQILEEDSPGLSSRIVFKKASEWLMEPNMVLKTIPLEMINSQRGTQMLLDYLESLLISGEGLPK